MIEVLEAGVLTSVQDARGRIGWRRFGVPAGGAVDPWSARLANRLVGGPDDAALLEITLGGPVLRFERATLVALAGATFEASVDGLPLPMHHARGMRAGGVLRIGAGQGARSYLAVSGGIDVEPVLGSPSTDLRTGFGGIHGRSLQRGDRLETGRDRGSGFRWTGAPATGPIRLVTGPQAELFEPLDGAWRVGADADRSGVRLDGRAMQGVLAEVPSMGLAAGAIQVPPDGRPIVMLADRPVTGGYPVPACVIGADVGRVGRLRPGEEVRFASVSMEEAREALRRAEEELAALEPLDVTRDDELGWAGSLE